MKTFAYGFVLFLLICLSSSSIAQQQQNAVFLNEYRAGLLSTKSIEDTASFIVARKALIQKTLAQIKPIIPLKDSLTAPMQLAQALALADSNFTKYIFDIKTRKPLLNEVFGVYPARPSDLRKGLTYMPNVFYRVEMYNYAYNLSNIAIVDIANKRVRSVENFPQTQPDIPKHLIQLATTIAINSEKVQEALGYKPTATEPLMASTKTALNRTRCERSLHLCVAPTFVQGSRALWAIVDLTDCRIAGIRWTNVGEDAKNIVVTERKVQNENITDCYCEKINSVTKYNWTMDYILTSSDGLMISNVMYKGQKIVNSAKLVDWHVSYSGTDGFGYSDAVGCPIFSQAAVVATEPPQIIEVVENDSIVGFVLEQKYFSELWPGACNYSYSQRYYFYTDGKFRVSCASLGRGCGNNGTYRPVFRIAFAGNNQSFFEWNKKDWQPWLKEKWQLQNQLTNYNKNGYQYKLQNMDGSGFYMQPGVGQFKDGGRGDNAFTYITKNHADKDEGETDMITIGPCCNTDYKQGPEKFIHPVPENIKNTDLVLWYVPQLKNDDTPNAKYCWAETYYDNGVYKTRTYPCFAGPMFVPIK